MFRDIKVKGKKKKEIAFLQYTCIKQTRSQNIILTGEVLKEKAKVLADAFGDSNYTCFNGWLTKFKEHQRIVCRMICREKSIVDEISIHMAMKK